MRLLGLAVLMVIAMPGVSFAGGDTPALGWRALIDLVSDKTVECRKEKDQRLCANYFSKDGVIRRLMYDDRARRDGVWFIDDQARLCVLWRGKTKPLCFFVYPRADGSYSMLKHGKHISTILATEEGNTRDLQPLRDRE